MELFKVDAELVTFSKKLWWDFLTIPGSGRRSGSVHFDIIELANVGITMINKPSPKSP